MAHLWLLPPGWPGHTVEPCLAGYRPGTTVSPGGKFNSWSPQVTLLCYSSFVAVPSLPGHTTVAPFARYRCDTGVSPGGGGERSFLSGYPLAHLQSPLVLCLAHLWLLQSHFGQGPHYQWSPPVTLLFCAEALLRVLTAPSRRQFRTAVQQDRNYKEVTPL